MTTDYDIRGADAETELVRNITDAIIDADRLTRADLSNGFPNFAMYRLILAGDRGYLGPVRQWWVLFSLEWCRTHMRGGYSEELATVAAWDSLQRVMDPPRPLLVASEAAESLGVSLPTYLHARGNLEAILRAALDTYWGLLCGTYRIVRWLERREPTSAETVRYWSGRGFGEDELMLGANLRAYIPE